MNKEKKNKSPVFSTVATTAVLVLAGMTLYEAIKQWIAPGISIWGSHAVTILFSALIASLVAYYILKRELRREAKIQSVEEEKRRVDEELTQSRKNYFNVVEKSPDSILIHQDGIIKFVNRRISRFTGFPVEKFIGKNIMEFVAPDYRKMVEERYRRRLSGEDVPSIYEIALKLKGGSILPVEINVNTIDYEGAPAFLVYLRDISERKRAEAGRRELTDAVETSERRLRAVLDAVPELIFVIDSEGRYLEFFSIPQPRTNKANYRLRGKTVNNIFPDETAREIQNVIDRALSTGEIQHYEYPLDIKGDIYWYSGRGDQVRISGG